MDDYYYENEFGTNSEDEEFNIEDFIRGREHLYNLENDELEEYKEDINRVKDTVTLISIEFENLITKIDDLKHKKIKVSDLELLKQNIQTLHDILLEYVKESIYQRNLT